VITEGFQVVTDAEGAKGATANKNWASLAGSIAALQLAYKDDDRIENLNEDVKGRMTKAMTTKERFNRWGKHYLRALLRAHQLEQCTNFMDPGLQLYGGSLFKEVKDAGGKIFISLPQPIPSRTPAARAAAAAAAAATAAPAYAAYTAPAVLPAPAAPDMQDYYAGSGGGCFSASSTVIKLSRGKEIETPIAKLHKGDQVKVMNGQESFASVLFVVKTQRPQHKHLLQLTSGLIITPNHPIRVNDVWQSPSSLSSTKISHEGWVYNVILDQGHVLLVNGVECITWGHNLKGDVRHSFYGSSLVVENVKALEREGSKVVEVRGTWRDSQGQVVGLW